jgi:hypothetical protein
MDCLVGRNQTRIGLASNIADDQSTSLAPILTMLRIRSWEEATNQIPVPGISARASAGVLQWLELEARFRKANPPTVRKQTLAIGRHQVRH